MSIYERIKSGETLKVRLTNPVPGLRVEPFEVGRLLLMGPDHYVTESSEWARYAQVGGIVINGRNRKRMDQAEMQDWCENLEVRLEHQE